MFLIDNARHWWRLWSIRLAALAAFPGICWPLIPEDLRNSLPPQIVTVFAIVASVSIIFARLVPQPKLPTCAPKPEEVANVGSDQT